jgi:hypothetical protein
MAPRLKDAVGKVARKAAKNKNKDEGGEPTPPPPNAAELASNMAGFLKSMDALKDDQEKANGEFMADLTATKERYANLTGYSRKHLSKVYNKHRRELKEELDRREMDAGERDQLDALMAACVDLPLFGAAAAPKS